MQDAPVFPYAVRYGVAYVLITCALAAVSMLFDMLPSGGLTITPILVAAGFAVWRFVRDKGRVPSAGEKWRLVFQSLLLTILLSAAMVVVMLLLTGGERSIDAAADAAGGLDPVSILPMTAVLLVLHVLALWFCYGPLARIGLRMQAREAA